MEKIINSFAEEPEIFIPFLAIGGGFFVAIIAMITGTIKSIASTEKIERSRREIAAYIAEGSMSPEEGERLLKAGREKKA